MKKNYSWIRELGLLTVVSSLVLLMFPSGSMAAQGDWIIYHNEENVQNGGDCNILASDGENHVEGTFEWGYTGVSFLYTYDRTVTWKTAPASYQSGYYVFDFYTEWDPEDYGDQFEIQPSAGPWYSCDLPL